MTIKIEDFTRSLHASPIKAYNTYDGSGRLEYTFEANSNAKDGDACLVTQYAYSGATTRVVKWKESLSVWSAAYDI